MGEGKGKLKQIWAWASHASLAQWLLTPIWGQIMAAASAVFIVIESGWRELPLALTVPAALATYVLVLAVISGSLDLWKKWWSREAALSTLRQLRGEGISLRNRVLSNLSEYAEWKAEVENWRRRVLDEAQKVDRNLKEYLENLDRMGQPPAGIPVVHLEHERWITITSEILARLQRYLEKELRLNE